MTAELILITNDRPLTDSILLAEAFQQRHDLTIRKIRNILSKTDEKFVSDNFEESVYSHGLNGKDTIKFLMTKDGFMHIALTFTGERGNSFRIRVINAFNEAEERLQQQRSRQPTDIKDLLQMALDTLNEKEKVIGEQGQKIIKLFKTKAQISDKQTSTAMVTASKATLLLAKTETELVKTKTELTNTTVELVSLKQKLGKADDWKHAIGWKASIKAFNNMSDVYLGKNLSSMSRSMNLEIKKAPHHQYGTVNVYHRQAAEALAERLK